MPFGYMELRLTNPNYGYKFRRESVGREGDSPTRPK